LTKESLVGQEEMFDREDGIDRDISDVEQIDSTKITGNSSIIDDDDDADSTANSTNEGSDLDTDGDDDELAEFDAKLAQALKTRASEKDGVPVSNDEPSEEDMDDEQMEALDEQLGKIFEERKLSTSKKFQRKDAKEMIINFKCRVIELLEIFVKEQHMNPLALKLLIPLLITIRTTKSSLVSKKACDLMREYTRLCKGKNVPDVNETDALFDLLASTHEEAMREGSNAYASACSQASLLIIKVLVAQDREHLRRVVSQYAATQERFLFDSKCKVKTSFFSDWLNWCSSARK
jgi:DNA polymerase phi